MATLAGVAGTSNLQPPVLETGALAIELHSYIKDLVAAEPLMLPRLLPNSCHLMRAAAVIADRKTVSSLAAASSCIVSVTWL